MNPPRRSYETRAEILTAEVINDRAPQYTVDRMVSQLVEGRRNWSGMNDDVVHDMSLILGEGYPTS